MRERTIEDELREEYFDLLPDMRRVAEWLETEVRHRILRVSLKLASYEHLEVKSRIKECESAVDALRRRQADRAFDEGRAGEYSLASLNDLAGVRVLAFPRARLGEVHEILHKRFPRWEPDHVPGTDRKTKPIALKYHGYCRASTKVKGEVQIVPMLLGLFWEVEHAAIYKPDPRLKGAVRDLAIQERYQEVLDSLTGFEEEFEVLLSRSQ